MTLFVSKIQRFSIADGDGIRTTVFLSGCNLRCAWCHNPETQEMRRQVLRFPQGNDEICGKKMTVDEAFAVILRDLDFYKESGGGVTVSGGEPLLQAEAVAELLKKCKEAGIHTIVDTAGAVPYESIEAVLPYTDVFYYDIKGGNEKTYQRFVGGSLALVKENLARLTAAGGYAVARIPLLTGVNADARSREGIAKICHQAGVREIHLLPYHKYGISKYQALGRVYPMQRQPYTAASLVMRNADDYRNSGFTVRVEQS